MSFPTRPLTLKHNVTTRSHNTVACQTLASLPSFSWKVRQKISQDFSPTLPQYTHASVNTQKRFVSLLSRQKKHFLYQHHSFLLCRVTTSFGCYAFLRMRTAQRPSLLVTENVSCHFMRTSLYHCRLCLLHSTPLPPTTAAIGIRCVSPSGER
uniref:Uncharacterized protein n=1 Tax=Trypanosoma congolense (strain IL3000) TaxID=1068625 RepID=G0UPP8_TRYCI|nr:hypothetical protein TCIL3000_7_1670 [Trypanosoma congolense IL3000]